MKRILMAALALMLLPMVADAGRFDEAKKQAEASMGLTGSIIVGPDGDVREYSIDKQDKVSDAVLGFLKSSVAQWKFEPMLVDGKPVATKSRMYLNLIAKVHETGGYEVRVGGVSFSPYFDADSRKEEKKRAEQRLKDMPPPRYPGGAARAGAQGTAYLILKLNPDGTVQDAYAEKVNLGFVSNEKTMETARKVFADVSIQAAMKWKLPTEDLDKEDMQVRVPVDFCLDRNCDGRYGQWRAYMPGPTRRAPWRTREEALGFSPDALPATGGVFPAGETGGLKLRTLGQAGS